MKNVKLSYFSRVKYNKSLVNNEPNLNFNFIWSTEFVAYPILVYYWENKNHFLLINNLPIHL